MSNNYRPMTTTMSPSPVGPKQINVDGLLVAPGKGSKLLTYRLITVDYVNYCLVKQSIRISLIGLIG